MPRLQLHLPHPACLPALFFLQDPRLELAEAIETLCLSHPKGEELSSRELSYSGNLVVHNHQTNVYCKLRQNQPGRKLWWLNIPCIINRSCLIQHEITRKQ